ncbi:esterase-like activity of phytase family protein [Sabulicella rubraurantiaca]|uniref:esterase-like activity of phytase family protein n=1 Tax=Sabulicella rubraurantiaca TaxID=2811429 RepID=UPI001A971A74|nr:esterase-like activity of phytase family protein [Sabulicella rubraurantiaca]
MALDTTVWGFGGFSGAHLAGDLTLTVVSDRGRWWQAKIRPDPLEIDSVRHGPLRDLAGRPLRGTAGDAESLARLPDGSWLVGFERQHRIWRYERLDGPARHFPAPPGLEAATSNGGLESLTLLPDGRLLAIAETLGREGLRVAWLGQDAGWEERLYRAAPGYSPTDAAALPGGGVLVLERDFSLFGGFRSRLAHVANLSAPVLESETWLEMPGDALAENWEAVSVTRTREGVLVVLLSDDNQNLFQRSLLALYRLG